MDHTANPKETKSSDKQVNNPNDDHEGGIPDYYSTDANAHVF